MGTAYAVSYKAAQKNKSYKSADFSWDWCSNFIFYFQKTYTIKDCRLDTKFLPQYLQAGWYKICILIYDLDGIQSSGLEANVHLQ